MWGDCTPCYNFKWHGVQSSFPFKVIKKGSIDFYHVQTIISNDGSKYLTTM